MKKIIFIVIAFFQIVSAADGNKGNSTPVQLALFTPIQVFAEHTSIEGVRLNLIYGRNTTLTGFDFGFVNHLTSGHSKGIQFGFVGIIEEDFTGWMDNSVNYVKGRVEGLQFGFFNYGGEVSGIQIGIVNYAERMHGLQIGFINVINKNGAFPIFPIINWSF